MLHKNDLTRLQHIVEAAREAQGFVAGQTFESFQINRMMQYSVIHCIEIIGEASTKISTDFCEAHPEIPWSEIIGMRNRLIHAYFDINVVLVLLVVRDFSIYSL